MSKYIDAEKLSEKIESIGLSAQKSADYNDGRNDMKMMVLDIIDSLQQEHPRLPGLEELGIPGKDYIPIEWVDACERYGKWKIVKQEQMEDDFEEEWDKFESWMESYDQGDYPTCYSSKQIARHFFELGLNRIIKED